MSDSIEIMKINKRTVQEITRLIRLVLVSRESYHPPGPGLIKICQCMKSAIELMVYNPTQNVRLFNLITKYFVREVSAWLDRDPKLLKHHIKSEYNFDKIDLLTIRVNNNLSKSQQRKENA